MASGEIDEQDGQYEAPGSTVADSADRESDADFGQRMASSEEEAERYTDNEDTNPGAGDGPENDAETRNTPNSVTAFAQNARHD